MRIAGIGVIHGGENALRFTPHFAITSAEIDLIIGLVRDVLVESLDEAQAPERQTPSISEEAVGLR